MADKREPQGELLQGTLDLLILKYLAPGSMHGYNIAEHIQQTSADVLRVEEGALYPALHRLEERGWLDAEWKDTSTGREAKFYKLTRVGRKQLDTEVLNWEQLTAAVSMILRTSE